MIEELNWCGSQDFLLKQCKRGVMCVTNFVAGREQEINTKWVCK